jgi:hypothetical protein
MIPKSHLDGRSIIGAVRKEQNFAKAVVDIVDGAVK